MHKPAEATKAELENLYKKHHAYNRLAADSTMRNRVTTSLWMDEHLIKDAARYAESRGFHTNPFIVEALAWGMCNRVETSNEYLQIIAGKSAGGMNRKFSCPRVLLQHVKHVAVAQGQSVSEVVAVTLAKYLFKAGALTTPTGRR